MPPKLEPVFTFRLFITTQDTLPMGSTKGGPQRVVQPFNGGSLSGEGINAEFVQGGSDRFTFDPATNTGYTDARAQFRERDEKTGETNMFFLQYRGVVVVDEKFQLALQGNPDSRTTKGEEHYCFSSVELDVSNDKHKWMERTALVGQGHIYAPGDGTVAAEYEVYKLVSS
jgi:hypothetical protein